MCKKAHTPIKSSMECYALYNLTKKAVLTPPKNLHAHMLERITSAILFTVIITNYGDL